MQIQEIFGTPKEGWVTGLKKEVYSHFSIRPCWSKVRIQQQQEVSSSLKQTNGREKLYCCWSISKES